MLSDIRTGIKNVLESVVTDGNVYAYERFADTEQKILSLFRTATDKYHGWIISRIATETKAVNYKRKARAHIFRIQGFYGLKDDDATEFVFQDLLETIEIAFDIDKTLNATCETIWATWGSMNGIPGFQIKEVGTRMIGGKLCHYADCRLCAVELPNPSVDSTFPIIDYFIYRSGKLEWATSGADSCSIDQNIGAVEKSGTYAVSPNVTTTYTLTAVSIENEVTKTCTITKL